MEPAAHRNDGLGVQFVASDYTKMLLSARVDLNKSCASWRSIWLPLLTAKNAQKLVLDTVFKK
jgi:hypothetical protein